MGKSTKWPFSIAMLVYQRVNGMFNCHVRLPEGIFLRFFWDEGCGNFSGCFPLWGPKDAFFGPFAENFKNLSLGTKGLYDIGGYTSQYTVYIYYYIYMYILWIIVIHEPVFRGMPGYLKHCLCELGNTKYTYGDFHKWGIPEWLGF